MIKLLALALAVNAFADAGKDGGLPSAAAGVVKFKDRTVDVKAYVEGFAYKNFYFEPEIGKVFFVKKGDAEHLYEAPFKPGARVDFKKAKKLSDIDFSKRNLWGIDAGPDGRIYLKGDEDNTEIINLYELKGGAMSKLTSEGYIYGWEFSPDGKQIAFLARSGSAEFTPGTVGILDLATGKVRKVYSDSKALRMTWSSVSWAPDGSALALGAVCNEDRTHQELLLVKTDGSGAKSLLGCKVKRGVEPTWEWLDAETILYSSDERGNSMIFSRSLKDGESRALTDEKWNLTNAQLIETAAGKRLVALERKPISTVLHVVDPRDGAVLSSTEYKASLGMAQASRSTLMISMDSPVIPFEYHALSVEDDKPKLALALEYDAALKKKVVHCEAEKVSFKTWDGFAAPGEDGTLHAFLYKPKKPATGKDARLLVVSFYGGTNNYSPKTHMFCNAGFYVLSPAPRGSWDWGREFHDKMQGDLGGGEILDVVEAAKQFSAKLGIPPEQVGAYGGSHGGYATLRALTLPESVNGYSPDFRFGFGLSDYGISNLVRYVKNCNIPGWITDMTKEDPAKNPKKWLDRSPETHACRASGPLFLSHGTNDKRVGIDESRAMMDALKKCGRTRDSFYELPGQGHGYKGTAPLLQYYSALFGFLAKAP